MSMTSGRSFLLRGVIEGPEVRLVVFWRSLARGWAERKSESRGASSAELEVSELSESLDRFLRFRGVLVAHSGAG